MAPLKDVITIVSDIATTIVTKRSDFNTSVGTVTNDVVIEPVAVELATNYVALDTLSQAKNLQTPEAIATTDLDNAAKDVGLERSVGSFASGYASFIITSANSNVTIPYGTVVLTANPGSQSFTTTSEGTFLANSATTYLDDQGRYLVNVPITASIAGTAGNVTAASIDRMATPISGVSSVTNLSATTGGTDAESNTSLATRIIARQSGNNYGTSNGYLSLVNNQVGVEDAVVIGPNDSEMTRNEYGRSVDIYIIGSITQEITETITFAMSIPLLNVPIIAVSKIVTAAGATFPVTDYNVVIDTGIYAGTISCFDHIEFVAGSPNLPAIGTSVNVTYTFNDLIISLQDIINADANKLIVSDVLVREANLVNVNIKAWVKKLPGYDTSTVQSAVLSNLQAAINAGVLGTDIRQSDIIGYIENTAGVDYVVVTTPTDQALVVETYTNISPTPTPVTDIILDRTQYARTDSITVTMI